MRTIKVNYPVRYFLATDEETAGNLAAGLCEDKLTNYLFGVPVPPPIITGVIDYPLKPFSISVTVKHCHTIGKFLWDIAQEYQKLYNDGPGNPHGIWGHGIEDLFFEGIAIHGDTFTLHMGS